MNNDYNFEQFIKLLDGALASDDKNVKQALRKFLFVAAMVMGNETEPGPFTKMMETIDSLQQRISTLENKENLISPSYTDNTTWTSGNIAGGITGTTGYIWPTTTTAATTNIMGGSTTNITSIASSSSIAGTTSFFTSDENPKGTAIKEEIVRSLDDLAKQD